MALVATILLAAALSAPPRAAAEGTTPVLPQAPALPDAAVIVNDVLAVVAESAIELPVMSVPAVPAAEPVPQESHPSPPVEPAPPAPDAPDTTTQQPDTTETRVQPVAAGGSASAAQVQPTNVNVSVRIDSPGDDGSVVQVNASEVAATGPQPDAAPVASPGGSRPPTAQHSASSATPTADGPSVPPRPETDVWTWTWGCGDSGPEIVLTPLVSGAVVPTIWNWNWNWNCGGGGTPDQNSTSQLPAQYQAGATQYQPGNINVSVRIASSGDNGPVVQSNVAGAVAAAAVAAVTVSARGGPTPRAPAPTGLLAIASSAAVMAEAAEVTEGMVPAAVSFDAVTELAAVAVELVRGEDLGLGVAVWDVDEIVRSGLVGRPATATNRPVRPEPRRIPYPVRAAIVTTSTWTRPPAVATRRLPGAAAQPPLDSPRAPRASEPPPVPRPSLPERVPLATLNLGGIAPGSGGDLGFLFLLLIPFAFALADSARRATREVSAVVAQVESSRRERPG